MYQVIEKLMTNARHKLVGSIDGAIKLELFNVVDEFCRRSDANRYAAPIPIVAGTVAYTVTFPHEVVIRVFNVNHEFLDTHDSYYDPDSGLLAFKNEPTAHDALYPAYLNVSLAPKAEAVENPDDWMPELNWQRYYNTLLWGLLGAMHGQPAKPYYSEKLATYYTKKFRNGMNTAKALASVGNAPNASSWRFPKFAGR